MAHFDRTGRSWFQALGVLVALASIAAAAPHSWPGTALTIAPSSHDFGTVTVGTGVGQGVFFTVTLPPGGGPADSVSVSIAGQNAGDFRLAPPAANNECATPQWRTGSCRLVVEFVARAVGARNASLVVADTRGNRGTATLKGTGAFGCRMNVVTCNYSDHYSGNLQWTEVRTLNNSSGSNDSYAQLTIGVTVNVTGGVAFCDGTYTDTTAARDAGKLIGFSGSHGAIHGQGLFAVEFNMNKGVYKVTVACPSAQYTYRHTDVISGQTYTKQTASTPPELDGREWETFEQPASALGVALAGSLRDAHPDTDPSNGVSGTVSLTWTLNRVKAVP